MACKEQGKYYTQAFKSQLIKNKNHGDLDNYIKLVSDALNGVAYKDDKQVKELHGYLWYEKDERTEVEVKRIA